MLTNKECWYFNVCTRDTCDGCTRFIEMKYLMENSNIPKSQQIPKVLRPMTKHDYNEFLKLNKIKNNIVDFVKDGSTLYISSEHSGTSKTSWAIKLMLKYFDEIWPGNGLRVRGLFIHVPTFLQELKDFKNPLSYEYRENIKNCDLVIWDDIATSSKLTEYEYGQMLIYLDYRVLNNKSNIYTSNIITKKELDKIMGVRIASRILNNSTQHIIFEAKDGRGGEFI